ncbi:uncharacterized protein LOC125944386 [Dermacentor silvarum]|uniref:uncharacterized protein LOC125944386 n=1 Tax=Dermacentor silvarum TaxID=543639 RepID=UPI002100FB7C|nr:uncharacterized protein LOC125944386 [Dermacentor silvarum]
MAEKIFSASVGKLGKHDKDSQDLRRRFFVTAMARKARDAVPRTRRARVDEEPGERDKFILPALNLVDAAVEDVWPQESLRRVSGNSSRTDASDSTYQTGAVPDSVDQLRSPKDTVELPSAVREAPVVHVTVLNSTEEGSSHPVPANDELRPPLAVKRPRTMEPGKEPCEAQCAPLDAAANFQDTQDMDTS